MYCKFDDFLVYVFFRYYDRDFMYFTGLCVFISYGYKSSGQVTLVLILAINQLNAQNFHL